MVFSLSESEHARIVQLNLALQEENRALRATIAELETQVRVLSEPPAPSPKARSRTRYYCVVTPKPNHSAGLYNKLGAYRLAVGADEDTGRGAIVFAEHTVSKSFGTIREAEAWWAEEGQGGRPPRIAWGAGSSAV